MTMGELRIGDRVRTPRGLGVVTRFACGHAGEHSHVTLDGEAHQTIFYTEALEPLPRDIPREHVEMLHAAVAVEAERSEWKRRAEYAEHELSDAFGLPSSIGLAEGEAKRIVDEGRAAIADSDRLRRELEVLRAHVDERARQHERMFRYEAESALHDVSARIDAILTGEGER